MEVRSALATSLLLAACSHTDRAAPSSQTASPPSASTTSPAAPAGTPAPSAPAAGGFDISKPCSMITAAEVSAIVGFTVTSVDEGFRCKFPDSKGGWASLKLMEASLKSATEICDYAKAKRTVVPGVGDSTSYFGATVCTKVGDVAIIVDGADVAERSAQLQKSGAENPFVLIAKTVAGRIR
jgi:hypothetical protein